MKELWVWCMVCESAAISGPEQELTRHRHPLAIFCNQVFFVYDPSSATSLLSSVGISTRTLDVNQTPQVLREMWRISWWRNFVVENGKNSGSFGHVESGLREGLIFTWQLKLVWLTGSDKGRVGYPAWEVVAVRVTIVIWTTCKISWDSAVLKLYHKTSWVTLHV